MLQPSLRQPTPLSSVLGHHDPAVSGAYELCYRAQQHIAQKPARDHDQHEREDTLVHIRILGHMLTTASSDDASLSAAIADVIMSSQHPASASEDRVEGDGVNITALSKLGQFYKDHFIRTSRKFKGPNPVAHSHPSRPPFELAKEQVRAMLAETPKTYSKTRSLAMRREGYRCILSRFMDTEYYFSKPGSADTNGPRTTTMLELCHIFSESTNAILEHARKNEHAWSVLQTVGYTQIVEDLASAAGFHSLDNVMIMDGVLHHYFDTLKLWFEPIEGTQHRYRVVHVVPLSQYNLPDVVEFTSHEPDLPLPLPDRDYLRIHAACCRVSWLSGATALFDRLQRDMEEDPDAVIEAPAFTRSLHARLEYLSHVEAR